MVRKYIAASVVVAPMLLFVGSGCTKAEELCAAAVLNPGKKFVGVQSEGDIGAKNKGRMGAPPVIRRPVADFGGAAGYGRQGVERVYAGIGFQHADADASTGHGFNQPR